MNKNGNIEDLRTTATVVLQYKSKWRFEELSPSDFTDKLNNKKVHPQIAACLNIVVALKLRLVSFCHFSIEIHF